jgi:hypothetical protein
MRAPAIALALAVAGCGVPDLGAAGLVQGLRVLGIQAEPPEVKPGQQTMLTAWVADTKGGTIDVTWSACLLPSDGVANAGCTDGSGNGLVGLGSGLTLPITVPDVDASNLGPPDATYGVYLPIVAHVVDGPDVVDSVYRLRIRVPELIPEGCTLDPPYPPHCAPNENPSFASIDPLPDEPTVNDVHDGQSWSLYPHYTASGEEYAIPGSSKPTVFERQITQWFATAGTFPDTPVGGTGVQKWTVDRDLPSGGGAIDLWVVGHDDRGGSCITHRGFILK